MGTIEVKNSTAVPVNTVVTQSAVIGVDIGDILLSIKSPSSDRAQDVTSEPTDAVLCQLDAMKAPIEVTLQRRKRTWVDQMKSFGLQPHKLGSDKYEFNNIARALSKKVLLDQTGDDPRKIVMELEKQHKDQLQLEETKLQKKWQQMKDKISKLKSTSNL